MNPATWAGTRRWVRGLAVAALVLAAAIPLTLRGRGDRSLSAEPQPKAPRLVVEKAEIDAGVQPVNAWVEQFFTLSNTGSVPLEITETPQVETLVGDITPELWLSDIKLEAGMSGWLSLRLLVPPGEAGPHAYRVMLHTNDPTQPVTELVFRATFE